MSECRSKFPVAADTDDQSVEKLYDAVLVSEKFPGHANRTSYLITQDGKVAYTYTNLDPTDHVKNLLDALKALPAKQ
jgi:peroxiredoxin